MENFIKYMLIGILVKFITIISKILINIPVTILLDIEKGSIYIRVLGTFLGNV